jgi:radical SAM superfamily enzyme YgiQ (UPF0313 family)
MRVCLVSPPTVSEFNERLVAESEALRLIAQHAPMGVLSLAAVLDQQGVETDIVDLNRLYYEYVNGKHREQDMQFCAYVDNHLKTFAADVFGFSTICSSYPLTLRLARAVGKTHPNATVILGGPQASVVDVPTLENFPFVDLIVRGESEETLPRVLDALCHGWNDLGSIAGISYRSHGDVLRNPNAPPIENLDLLPMAAFHLYPHIADCSYAPLEAGRGCPFACSFCSTNDFFRRRFRMKSPDVLIDQMKSIRDTYGIESFDLIHDMFTVDRKKVIAFCDALKESGEKFEWSCSARTDCIDDELIDLMAERGCNGIFFGVDTGSDRMQSIIHKRLNLSDAAARIRRTNRRRIRHTVSLITGFPEETKADFRGTINFLGESLRHQHAEIQLHLLAPLAETPITSQYQEELIYDDIFSDISFQGWEQDPEERAMIIKYSRIFPNFYAVPTLWLDRQYLREVREFMLHAILKVRWLLLLLHRDSGDLLQVFDEWSAWSASARNINGSVDTTRFYYASDSFPKDLSRFVESHYVNSAHHPHLLRTMVQIENAQSSFADGEADAKAKKPMAVVVDSLDAVPVISADVRVLKVPADYKKLMRCLSRNERFDSVTVAETPLGLLKTRDQVKVVQLNRATYDLIRLCNGSRTINQIAQEFSVKTPAVSPLKASIYGLVSLAEMGFIDIRAALN